MTNIKEIETELLLKELRAAFWERNGVIPIIGYVTKDGEVF